ncbi:preprotein translocase subunit SecY, partial [Bacillus pseudomycoides]|nr:preprotein translocase subunit SecY [Bacillus pseudomycoides]
YLYIATLLTACTAFLLWLGEQITANGVCICISILIFAGIAAALSSVISHVDQQQFQNAGVQ